MSHHIKSWLVGILAAHAVVFAFPIVCLADRVDCTLTEDEEKEGKNTCTVKYDAKLKGDEIKMNLNDGTTKISDVIRVFNGPDNKLRVQLQSDSVEVDPDKADSKDIDVPLEGGGVAPFRFESGGTSGFSDRLISLGDKPLPKLALTCSFDTNGDGRADLELGDADDNGYCEFPEQTVVRGTLQFDEETPVETSGNTVIQADSIFFDEDAVFAAGGVRSLTLWALTGDLVSRGTLSVDAADDVLLKASRGSINLTGATNLAAQDRLTLSASRGSVTLAPAVLDANGPFTAFARNRIDITTKGADGSINIARASLGSFRITLSTKAGVSAVGAKVLSVSDHALVTTNKDRTGLANSSSILLNATGAVVLSGDVIIDSGSNLLFQTQRPQDDVCLAHNTTLEASDGRGNISFTGVHGATRDDGTTRFVGRILGGPVVVGPCS